MQWQKYNPTDYEGRQISSYTCQERVQYNAYMAHMKKITQIDEKYRKCVVYRLSIKGDKGSYVGHTIHLKNRKIYHKCLTGKWEQATSNQRLYRTIFEAGGWDSVHVEILEELPNCRNKIEAEYHEQKWIDKLQPTLNGAEVRYHSDYSFTSE